ncbi:MAG TPA: carboxypeptidase-like regulatory domain-containing protein [Micromonospora sp.]
MTAHRQAWTRRAGVVVALVASALLAVPAPPVLAAPPMDLSVSPDSVTVQAGSDATVTVTITTTDPGDTSVKVSLTGLPSGVSCASGCGTVNVTPGAQKSQLLTVKAASNAPAANGTRVTVNVEATSNSRTGSFSLTVKAAEPPQVQTVREISGKVTNMNTGAAITNATVMLTDSQGHEYSTSTGSTGSFRFLGSSTKPITPGQIQLGAAKDEYTNTKTVSANAGQSLTGQRIVLKMPAPTPTATLAEPTLEESLPEESAEATETPAGDTVPTAQDEDEGGMGSWLLIIVGGLLVALGVGAIVLLWMRRKENEGDEETPTGAGGAAPRSAVPPSRGAYHGANDETRVTNLGLGPDPTRVGGPSLADAPTMMHSRPLVDDEFPDPYGAPLPSQQSGAKSGGYSGGADPGWAGSGYGGPDSPTQVGYGAAGSGGYGSSPSSGAGYGGNAPASGGGYGSSSSGGYGNTPGYGGNAPASGGGYGGNAPASGGGYGSGSYGNDPSSGAGYGGNAPASGGGYGAGRGYGGSESPAGGYPAGGGTSYGERYDEPTGRYTGGGDEYGKPVDPYQTGSYDQSTGDGYGQSQSYGRADDYPPQAAGGYGQASGGGYGGYGQQQGYDASGGYDQPPAGGGYGQRGGYDQQGGYEQPAGQQGGNYQNRGYDQHGYYGDQGQDGRSRGGQPPADPGTNRAGRRLDWLDD